MYIYIYIYTHVLDTWYSVFLTVFMTKAGFRWFRSIFMKMNWAFFGTRLGDSAARGWWPSAKSAVESLHPPRSGWGNPDLRMMMMEAIMVGWFYGTSHENMDDDDDDDDDFSGWIPMVPFLLLRPIVRENRETVTHWMMNYEAIRPFLLLSLNPMVNLRCSLEDGDGLIDL